MTTLTDTLTQHKSEIVIFLATLTLGLIAIRVLLHLFSRFLRHTTRVSAIADRFLLSTAKILLYLVYLIALLTLLGIPTTSLVAVLSAFSLALSLALQSTLANFAGGLIILFTKPFEKGDYVTIDGQSGEVRDITVVNTRLITPDHRLITVPNSTVSSGSLVNFSREPVRRVEVTVPIPYEASVRDARDAILRGLRAHPKVQSTPSPAVYLVEYADSCLQFSARAWARREDFWDVWLEVREYIWEELHAAGIQIPYPQLDVHLPREGEK